MTVIIVVATASWQPFVEPFLHRDRYRREILTLYEQLGPGMTQQQLQHEMDSSSYPHLVFFKQIRNDGPEQLLLSLVLETGFCGSCFGMSMCVRYAFGALIARLTILRMRQRTNRRHRPNRRARAVGGHYHDGIETGCRRGELLGMK